MRAVCWNGKNDIRVETVPDPEILNPRDAVVRITSTAICGSDLHLYDGYIPTMKKGDILGHEFMGEVVAVFGAGPVGQFAIASAVMLGAERVIAIDQYDYRLEMARNKAGATDLVNFAENPDIVEQLKELTGGRGPDAV